MGEIDMAQVVDVPAEQGWGSAPGGEGALATFAPAAAAALADMEAAAWRSSAGGLLGPVARQCGAQLGLTPAAPPSGSPLPADQSPADQAAALAFAEQFCADVSGVTDEQRAALVAQLGSRTADFVQSCYVVDFLPRARAALDALFGPGQPAGSLAGEGSEDSHGELWDLVMEFLRVVARVSVLDAVTAELVRLRGARQHQCRLCKSLRNRAAIEAGADDDLFAAVDHPSDLPAAQQAALALTDALIWTPGRIDPSTVEGVRRHFSPSQAVALVLWITRNSSNKIAVALAADAPNVTEGVEIYDLDAAGDPVYGLTGS
jgi:hypothetical protein